MANFPTSLDDGTSLPNPAAGNNTNSPSHAGLHDTENAAIIATETKIGTGSSTPSSGKVLRATGTGTSAWGAANLTTDVTGTLPVANGGTGVTSSTGSGANVLGTAPTISAPNITGGATIAGGETLTGGLTVDSIAASGAVKGSNITTGWNALGYVPNTITALGNRSYNLVFNSVDLTSTLSPGMRLKMTRTVAAPTQCTSLNGTTQYYSKTSPAAMTFTNNFVMAVAAKASAYQAGGLIGRYDGTSGFFLRQNADGTIEAVGLNGGAGNYFSVKTYRSVPLNKWLNSIVAQVDMTVTTNTPTTNYIMIDGVDVPCAITRNGTNPTALVQAGNLNIGAVNGGTFYAGKIAQAAIFNAKVTQATMLSYISQGLTGAETSLISAYTFNNSINDLSANANNLTANGSAVATTADSPFGAQGDGTVSSTLEYGIVTKTAFSTNTTVTVQVPEGGAIPTTGGVNAVSYSTQGKPYLFPSHKTKWQILALLLSDQIQGSAVSATWYNVGNFQIVVPIGEWYGGYEAVTHALDGTNSPSQYTTLSTANNSQTDATTTSRLFVVTVNCQLSGLAKRDTGLSLASATTYYLNHRSNNGANTCQLEVAAATDGGAWLRFDNAYL